MMKKGLAVVLVAVLVSAYALADTVHMKNGVQVRGVVASRDENRVVVRIGERKVVLRTKEIARIEQNAETGVFDREKAKAAARARDRKLTELTGLTAAQRQAAEQAMDMLIVADPRVQEVGKRRLLAMGKKVDLFRYFGYVLPGTLPYYVPGVLEILVELDPKRAKPLVRAEVANEDKVARAVVVALLGRMGDRESAGLVVRGLVDHTPEVRVAAAYALGDLGSKVATPVLIENLKAFDQRIRNACRQALQQIWGSPDAPVAFTSLEDWQGFWKTQAASIRAYDVSMLQPLVEPGAEFEDE